MSNYEKIKQMSIDEMAIERIDNIGMYFRDAIRSEMYIGDFDGIENDFKVAIDKEIAWLESEAKA